MRKNSKIHPSPLHILSPGQMMVAGFVFLILLGAVLLTSPLSSANGTSTSFIDALFTATSAVCVTGLVVVDTSIHWSIFGKVVIILLIQVGGLGFMTLGTLVALIFGKKINLRQRILIKEALNQDELSGSVKLIKKVLKYTMVIEGMGAFILSFAFIPQFGFLKGIGYSIFTSISSFCNAGFDLMGSISGEYSSIVSYYNRPLIVFTISALIILGGIGFPVIINIVNKRHLKKLSLNSKMALVTTAILIVGGFLMIFLGEVGHALHGMTLWEKFQVAFFQSVTTRTAGYATIDLTQFRESTLFVMIILMFIGASPASTGGGIKVSRVLITFKYIKSEIKKVIQPRSVSNITMDEKLIDDTVTKNVSAYLLIYTIIMVVSFILITLNEFDIETSLTSVITCVNNVGPGFGNLVGPTGNFSTFSVFSKLVLCLDMLLGRLEIFPILFLFSPRIFNRRF